MCRRYVNTALLAVLFLLIHPMAYTATIHVPADHRNIQAAIEAAVDGDLILVAPGTYEERISFKGKAVTLKSEDGPHATCIDGKEKGTVVMCWNGERADSILDGFSITGGSRSGIVCYKSSPTIRNNIVSQNHFFSNVYPFASSGGGVKCMESSATIINNVISNNYCSNNFADGAGMYCADFSGTISHNVISYNYLLGFSFSRGAGLFLANSSALVADNIIASNQLAADGGGVYALSSSSTFVSNTIYGNSGSLGGGVCCAGESDTTITNTILWNNKGMDGTELALAEYNGISSILSVDHSDVEGGQPLVYIDPGCTLNWGSSNIDRQPGFADEGRGDLHLLFTSCCRNAGDNSAPGLSDEDFEGDPRVADGTVDIGADEFHDHLYHYQKLYLMPEDWMSIRLIGNPSEPFVILMGSGLLDRPVSTNLGLWHLQFPVGVLLSGTIPSNGIISIDQRIPEVSTVPLSFPLQAAVRRSLTNYDVLYYVKQ